VIPKLKKKPIWVDQKIFDELPEEIIIRECKVGKKYSLEELQMSVPTNSKVWSFLLFLKLSRCPFIFFFLIHPTGEEAFLKR